MSGLFLKGRYQSGQLGQTVNLLADAFVGSNPALPTGGIFWFIDLLIFWLKILVALGSHNHQINNSANQQISNAGVAQLVEHNPSKVRAAGSSLVSRSSYLMI